MTSPNTPFAPPVADANETEDGSVFRPRFSSDGLVTAVVTDADDGTVLMVAHMNAEALALTLETGIAHYWSRSRGQLWKKGETSGNLQRVAEMRTDCDQDVVLVAVRTDGHGSACHTGRKSCFYRHIVSDGENGARLTFDEGDRPRFDPATVYGNG
ncbi:MAG: phosphoribosyl-AMP cyclohydrolase [Roseitalea sp.]|jgi:phosphoribosyl-AMP cyclohydrolase|uniref:Phosphoribosyl-AMP cyclohydrolase n=1 Tax=Oceaniradius stylonematis TaxID=2184161 RepID=A0A3A8ARA1_9HYPH|nr:phosphoribosyl-AMP cyclohydrolase [Oceaniradius stylonematis]MBO6552311.1 phosphoribosyl-AMP cyclohydrolase [Roseitalea sp.]MBO6950769.1 phosphoribosyl-AMP cyclohydrolase [Rhizobiaceae bacterium]RNC95143.1 MAG: phosphoribosyl-AMP cyclohydrolase [Oricola sp.]MBO6591244.1 phosphoribosyl-AMP cyclohydrolase [Roseitalea sp.]MBO6599099.1 phosphoribosyl-AMP cyclohydrolase [Roseitalea sp.]